MIYDMSENISQLVITNTHDSCKADAKHKRQMGEKKYVYIDKFEFKGRRDIVLCLDCKVWFNCIWHWINSTMEEECTHELDCKFLCNFFCNTLLFYMGV